MLELRKEIRGCTKCELHKLMPDGCKPVPGIGPINAKIFCLAESPGADEVILEEPLRGLCGRYFDKLLIQSGLKREQCYISNVIHCRCTDNGKKNRPPKKEEIESCEDWTRKEINTIKPKIVIGFGKIACEFLYEKKVKKLGDYVGIIKQNKDYHFICTYHPSYLLQHGKDKVESTISHLKSAKDFIQDFSKLSS
jgi:DNA polymerase